MQKIEIMKNVYIQFGLPLLVILSLVEGFVLCKEGLDLGETGWKVLAVKAVFLFLAQLFLPSDLFDGWMDFRSRRIWRLLVPVFMVQVLAIAGMSLGFCLSAALWLSVLFFVCVSMPVLYSLRAGLKERKALYRGTLFIRRRHLSLLALCDALYGAIAYAGSHGFLVVI